MQKKKSNYFFPQYRPRAKAQDPPNYNENEYAPGDYVAGEYDGEYGADYDESLYGDYGN